MNKYSIIILFFLSANAGKFSAQQLTPSVLSPSGGFYSNDSGMLSFTTGEMSVVETFTSPSSILTQGFQQYYDFGTNTIEHGDQYFSFAIYPNPSRGIFNLVTQSEMHENIDVQIWDLAGKEIYRTSYYHQNNMDVESIDLSHVTQGSYLICLSMKVNNHNLRSQLIQKIQIVK